MAKLNLQIAGMHCKSCEMLIEGNLKKISGIKKVDVSYKTGQAEVYYDGAVPKPEVLALAVEEAGYKIGTKQKPTIFSKDKNDYWNFFYGLMIVAVLYVLAKIFGFNKINVNAVQDGLGVVFLVGLVAGVSTCMALIGGLVLSLSARHSELHPEATMMQKFRPHLYFNLGRIGGYALFGGIIGFLGSAFQFSANLLGIITLLVSFVMILMGLKLLGIFPKLQDKNFTLPKSVAKFFGVKTEVREYSHKVAILSGAATFFLPCGFTQAMQLYAVSSGSFIQGALIMGLFALGTSFGLLTIGGLSSLFKGRKAKIFFATAGVAVIMFGLFNISNGWRLIGVSGTDDSATKITNSDQEQVVYMDQNVDGYSPNILTVKKGIPVKWVITSKSTFSCASYIVMRKFNIGKPLNKGENIFYFTPTEVGEIPFSCSMGMYTGKFIVVDNESSLAPNKTLASAGGGTCGAGGRGGCGCGGGAATPAPDNSNIDLSNAQIIKSTYKQFEDISPSEFTVKKGQPVKWIIAMNEPPTGCMHNVVIRDLNVVQPMNSTGDTTVVFVPKEKGDLKVTCSMGIPRATIHVI